MSATDALIDGRAGQAQPGPHQQLADRPWLAGVRRRRFAGVGRHRLTLASLLAATGALYLVGLSNSGWANEFYAAAGQAGARSWKAFLFGSLDQSNFITVDKPPASLWVIDLSMRIFGVNSWSLLVPQALMGVGSVWLLYAAVRRVATPAAGLLAGAALATTPVAVLMFRFDNPDALLVLLMTAAAYAIVRAIDGAGRRWLVLVGALIGFAFLTKMMQGLLVVPALAAAYFVAAPAPVWRRIRDLACGLAALLLAAGWWIALVEFWPSGSRPYVGGSTTNSILDLTFGYNGLGRLDGSSNNGNVTGGTGGFSSGSSGLTRLFGSEMGTQISWLLPSALIALGALVWLTHGRPRTDGLRASVIVWGGWLLVTGVVLSFASGIIHPYYTVALAPAIAALVGIGLALLWKHARLSAAVVAAGAAWSWVLLGRASWHPELRWIVLAAGALAVAGLLARRLVALTAGAVAVALLLAPSAYAVQTASSAHTGAIPSAGPATAAGFGGAGGGQRGRGFGGAAQNGAGAQPNANPNPNPNQGGRAGQVPGGASAGGAAGGRAGFGGGLGGATTVAGALVTALKSDASSYAWVAATTGDNEAASLELATGDAVMSLGGYNGTDPAITLAQFKALVAAGNVHYYVADSQGFIGSTAASTSTAYAIQQWVSGTFTATTVGGSTVYDLSG